MNLTIDSLEKAHRYKRGQTVFPAPMEILGKFFKETESHTNEYIIQGTSPPDVAVDVVGNGSGDNVEEYQIYPRVNVEAVLHDKYQIDNSGDRYKKVIGVVYALDLQNPVIKLYSGYQRSACLNLCVFNPSNIIKKYFNDVDYGPNFFSNVPEYLNGISDEKKEYQEKIDVLINNKHSGEDLFNRLGHLAKKCIFEQAGMATSFNNLVKFISSSQAVSGIDNIYFKQDGLYSDYDLYQGLTATISAKTEMTKRPDLIYKSFEFFNN